RRDAMLLGVVRTFHVDGVRGTRPRAQLAADALLQPVRVLVQEVAPDVRPAEQRRDLLRILLGHVAPEDLAERDREPLGDLDHGPAERPGDPDLSPGRCRRLLAHRFASASTFGARSPDRGGPTNSGRSSVMTATV